MGTNIIAFVVVLGVLIFFHELGHFLVARLFGVGVEKFSLGFGPRLFGKTVGITDYRVSAIPLGGYVKMIGEEPDAEISPEEIPLSFTHKHVFKRFLIVAAGPAFNLLLAVLIYFGIFMIYGIPAQKPIVPPIVGDVDQSSPAHKAGIKEGDEVIEINGISITSWEQLSTNISESNGKTLSILIKRGKETLRTEASPKLTKLPTLLGEEIDRYIIGIKPKELLDIQKVGIVGAVSASFQQTYFISKVTVLTLINIVKGKISTKMLGGPIMIGQVAGDQIRKGMEYLLYLIAALSINLAILNFLPIPVLDGGHLLFFTIEAIMGKPVNMKMREVAQGVGVFLLIMLMIFVFYNDIARIFVKS